MSDAPQQLSLGCAQCRADTAHTVRVTERTPNNVVIEATCIICRNHVRLHQSGPHVSKWRLDTAARASARHAEIVKTPTPPAHQDLKSPKKDPSNDA